MSYVGVVLGSNLHTDGGGGGATFSTGGIGVSGCDEGDEAFFLLYIKISLLFSSFF
jgi:hypothetical protein